MRQIGINQAGQKKLSEEIYIPKIAEHGFRGFFSGVMEPERQVRYAELCAKHGITYEALHAPSGHINDIWLDGEGGDEMLRELLAAVDACVLSSAGILVVHLSSGQNAPSITDIGRARFTRLVEYAGKHKVRVAFENQRKLANLAWALETFKSEDYVDFCWDCGHEHCFTLGREYMPLFGDRLCFLHIHDNLEVFNGDKHMLPFDGKIDFDRVAEHIRNSGFGGTIMLEVNRNKTDMYLEMSLDDYLERAAKAARRLADMVDWG